MEPVILAIDTSCDETSAALSAGRRVLSNVISSQVNLHQKYGGVFPALAKRAHQEKIDPVINEALKRAGKSLSEISAIAVTQGPGLAIALEVGIAKAKELASQGVALRGWELPLIAVNHMEGHLYSCLAQNKNGRPQREIVFPALALLISGGHTELVLAKDHGQYQILGATLDDAVGEALDKAARILKLGYPGGPIIERLAETGNPEIFPLRPAMTEKGNLNFSYSGLKTQFLYLVENLNPEVFSQNLNNLAASFQEIAFEQLLRKTSDAIRLTQPKTLLVGGGVIANKYLRKRLRRLSRQAQIPIFFPPKLSLVGDNAAMIGIAAGYKFQRGEIVKDLKALDRKPRLSI